MTLGQLRKPYQYSVSEMTYTSCHSGLKEQDRVVLEGVLVNIKGTYKGQPVTWNTSLSRTDTGSASCELFYVSKARIDTKVYE